MLEKAFNDERAQIYETKSSRTDSGRGTLRILAYLLTSPMTLKECLSSYYVRFIFYCKTMYQDILSKFIALEESIVAQRGLSALPSIDELQDKNKEVEAMVYFAKHLYRQKHLCPFTCPEKHDNCALHCVAHQLGGCPHCSCEGFCQDKCHPVHWRARTERLIIQTTAAGQYVALNRGNTTANFIRDVLQFYGNTTNIYHLYTDNQAAEHIATQPTMNEHSRIIDTRHNAIRKDYIENSMRIGGVASSENTSDILTKNVQPHLHQKHCAALHILQPTLRTQSNISLTDGSRESSGGEDMSLVLNGTNLKNSDWSPAHTKAKKTLDTWASTMTQMTAMTTPPCGIDPFDSYLHRGSACHALNNNTNSENLHTISPTSLDMSRRASKNVSQGQSVIHGDAHNQIQWHSNRPTTTSIPMDPAIAKPDFELTSRADALSLSTRPKTPTRLSKNDEAQKHEKTETVYQSANFVTVDNNLSQLKS